MLTRFLPHLRNASWGSIEYLFYPLLMLLATPLFVKALGVADYGLWMLVMAVAALSGAANMGMGAATVKYVSEYRGAGAMNHASSAVRQSLGIALAGGVFFAFSIMIAAPWLATHVFPEMGDPARVCTSLYFAAILLLAQQADAIFSSTLKGLERFDLAAKLEVGSKLSLLAGALVVASTSGDLDRVLMTLIVISSLSVLLKGMFASKQLGASVFIPLWTGATARQVMSFGAWAWVLAIGGALFQSADRLIVGAFLGADAVAHYTICSQLAQQIHAVPAAAMAFLMPVVSRKLGANPEMNMQKINNRGVLFNVLLSVCLAAGLIFFGGMILKIWMGSAFAGQNTALLMWLAGAYFILSLNVVPHYLLLGRGQVRFVALSSIVGGMISAVVMAMLLPVAGLVGAAWGRMSYGSIVTFNFIRLYDDRGTR